MESFKKKVEKRAYELFLARGGVDGYHIQDWNQAEKEIREEEKKAAEAEKKAKPTKETQKPEPVHQKTVTPEKSVSDKTPAHEKVEPSKKMEPTKKPESSIEESKAKKGRTSGSGTKKRVSKKKSS